jgi:diaminopimelate decarboxylase
MAIKNLPFSSDELKNIISKFPTPFHIYDEKAMKENAQKITNAFSWNEGFKEYYAVKAAPNPYLMTILRDKGFGSDCSSYPELVLSEKTGIVGEDIIFTSNNTPVYEFQKAKDLGAIINLDDITHFSYLEENVGLPELICFRYNPGALKEGNTIIGHPEEAKYGLTREQIFEAYALAKNKGIKRFGLHTMVASNELDVNYFAETAEILYSLVVELHNKLDINIEFVNLGGGIGIPYKPEQEAINWDELSAKIKEQYNKIIVKNGLPPIKIFLESGRAITGPYGYLVTTVQHIKNTYKNYVGLDASMHNLMRPALYGAYHHITVVGKENQPHNMMYDVTGSLCENNDKFAIDRYLPEVKANDIVVIHDTGAHGHSMGFNYNAKLRSAELLLRENGSVDLIRRAETIDDHFATLDFSNIK